MGIHIRRLGPGDEDVLALIAREADDFDLAGASRPESPLQAPEAGAYLDDPAVLHWVAEDGSGVVGELLCHVLRLPSGSGRELLLYSIGVRAAHRRRGVGSALLREMLEWARAQGIEEIWVLADNPGAEAFYAACGFAHTDEGDRAVYLQRQVSRRRRDLVGALARPAAGPPPVRDRWERVQGRGPFRRGMLLCRFRARSVRGVARSTVCASAVRCATLPTVPGRDTYPCRHQCLPGAGTRSVTLLGPPPGILFSP